MNPLLWPCLMKGSRGSYPRIDCYEQIMFSCTTEQRDGFDCTCTCKITLDLMFSSKDSFPRIVGRHTSSTISAGLGDPRTIVS